MGSLPHRDFEHRQFPEDVLCPRKLLRVFTKRKRSQAERNPIGKITILKKIITYPLDNIPPRGIV